VNHILQPHFEILPPPQLALWPELAEIPAHFVLYGGTALALRLGHRQSLAFDFFTSQTVIPAQLLHSLKILAGAKILQNTTQTLTVSVHRAGPIKLSFFGGLKLGRVGQYDLTSDGFLKVASLLDLAGTKAAVITQRAEAKDYLDLLAIIHHGPGIDLARALAAAQALYGEQYNPIITVKSLNYFGDGDLHTLTQEQKAQLQTIAASARVQTLPTIPRVSDHLTDP
jgi:hypothetical protein